MPSSANTRVTSLKPARQAARFSEELREENLRALSTPIIEIWDGVVVLPVIGKVSREHAARMNQMLLDTIAARRAEFAIVDLAGVTVVDAATASHLLSITRSASLLGSRCLLSGISAAVARSMVSLDAEVGGLVTFSTLQPALRHAIVHRTAHDRTESQALGAVVLPFAGRVGPRLW